MSENTVGNKRIYCLW